MSNVNSTQVMDASASLKALTAQQVEKISVQCPYTNEGAILGWNEDIGKCVMFLEGKIASLGSADAELRSILSDAERCGHSRAETVAYIKARGGYSIILGYNEYRKHGAPKGTNGKYSRCGTKRGALAIRHDLVSTGWLKMSKPQTVATVKVSKAPAKVPKKQVKAPTTIVETSLEELQRELEIAKAQLAEMVAKKKQALSEEIASIYAQMEKL